jgi:hypothetical protein
VARQLVNFIQWQQQHHQQHHLRTATETDSNLESSQQKQQAQQFCIKPALIKMLGWNDPTSPSALHERMQQLLLQETTATLQTKDAKGICDFPIDFLDQSIEDFFEENNSLGTVVYLSPDAEQRLDPTQEPPRIVMVGMLVDRRVRPHQSRNRAARLQIPTYRLPLDETVVEIQSNIDDDNGHDDNKDIQKLDIHEPLNIDTVLELMQRWWWNCDNAREHREIDVVEYQTCYYRALQSSLEHHQQRHPRRPLHNIPGKIIE